MAGEAAGRVETLCVGLGARSYDIHIGAGVLDQTASFIASRVPCTHAVVITDTNVEPLYGRSTAERLAGEADAQVDLLVVEAGEASKCVDMADAVWRRLAELRADRSTLIVAVGGGVVGDLAGFAAATYARGIPFVQIPTSVLAQVDSSVGGKVGIDLPEGKNLVGAFWQPRGVLIDVETCRTLSDRDYRAGLAEVVKYGVILDAEFFAYLEQRAAELNERRPEVLRPVIARCCQLKADVVMQDERDVAGVRAALNYGHTFGHAVESVTGYEAFLHGEAVAIGMLCASRLAEKLGRIDAAATERQRRLLESLGLPTRLPPLDPDQLLEAMQRDKKVAHGRLRFVLPTRLGRVELVEDVPRQLVLETLREAAQ